MNTTTRRAALAAASMIGLLVLAGPTLAAKAARPASGPLGAVRQFITDFNKGDMAGVKATHVEAPTIIDEPAPHLWNGPGAIDGWLADLVKDAKANGDTGGRIRLGSVAIDHVEADTAYIQIHADYLYREHHKAMVEPGGFTFALSKAGGDWKIAAWAWNGSKAHEETVAAKPAATAPKTAPMVSPKI